MSHSRTSEDEPSATVAPFAKPFVKRAEFFVRTHKSRFGFLEGPANLTFGPRCEFGERLPKKKEVEFKKGKHELPSLRIRSSLS